VSGPCLRSARCVISGHVHAVAALAFEVGSSLRTAEQLRTRAVGKSGGDSGLARLSFGWRGPPMEGP